MPDGTFDIDELETCIRPLDDPHHPLTGLIALENTHNYCGGKVVTSEFLSKVGMLPCTLVMLFMVKQYNWVISLFGLVLRSAELLSETTVNHSPPGIIIVVFTCPQIFIIIIIIIIDNRILNFLDCILIGIFHRENVLNFHGRKNGRHFERRDAVSTFLNTFIFSEILPACAKEYLTAARYYCQAEVKVRDRVAAVDAIFPPISRSDIISKQYGGRRVGLQMCNCDSFVKMS